MPLPEHLPNDDSQTTPSVDSEGEQDVGTKPTDSPSTVDEPLAGTGEPKAPHNDIQTNSSSPSFMIEGALSSPLYGVSEVTMRKLRAKIEE